jgi:hypothetical protein
MGTSRPEAAGAGHGDRGVYGHLLPGSEQEAAGMLDRYLAAATG